MKSSLLPAKSVSRYLAWAKKNPVGRIPKAVSREGAGENRIPLAHLANSLPVYLIFKDILEQSTSPALVLEIGCGTGRNITFIKESLADSKFKFTAIDYSPACIGYAKKAYGKSGVVFKTYKGKILPFKNNSFDFVVSSHVLEHIPQNNQQYFVNEVSRVLKKGGQAVIGTPNRKYCQDLFWKNPNDLKKYRFILPHEHEVYLSELKDLFKPKLFSRVTFWQTTNSYWRKIIIKSVKNIRPDKHPIKNIKFEIYSLFRKQSFLQDLMARIGTEVLMQSEKISYKSIITSTRIIKNQTTNIGDNFIVSAKK